jgi:uncharacterized lipoprotein YajG
MKKCIENSAILWILLVLTACATSTTNLVVNIDPLDSLNGSARSRLANVFVEDVRSQETSVKTREAAFGVSMGTVSFTPTEIELVKRELES